MATTQQIVDQFPAFASILQIPDVANLVELASAPGQNWSPDYFREQLWNTHWWKSTPESVRAWEATKLVDPATAAATLRTTSSSVIAKSAELGLHLSPGEVAIYSEQAAQNGWDDAMLTRSLLDSQAGQRFQAGSVHATMDALRSTLANYGFPGDDRSLMTWAKNITAGRMTTQGFEDYAKSAGKLLFPTLAKEIDAGFTVKQIADPYLQIASQTLGIGADQMSLTDPKWQRALQSRDAKGNMIGPMNTLDWQKTLMTDPTYGYDRSQNGQTEALKLRDTLGQTFGVLANSGGTQG